MISLRNIKLGIRKRCLSTTAVYWKCCLVIFKKRDNTDESSITFAKDRIKDNDDSGFKTGDKHAKGTGFKREKLNNGKLLKFQEAQIFIRAY